MVKRKNGMMPVKGGVRKRRNTAPTSNGTIIEYSAQQQSMPPILAHGYTGEVRPYIPGFGYPMASTIGPEIVSSYSSAKFLPGTRARWEPSVSFSSTGRVFVGFTDNPEVALGISNLYYAAGLSNAAVDWAAYSNAVKGLGSMVSFPVWQETEIEFPTRLRRKMFDTNASVVAGVDVYDRCMQTEMFIVLEGVNTLGSAGGFWFHDKVQVEGLHARIT